MKPLIVLGVCLALLGGLTAWLLLGRQTVAACNGLPENERVRKALGATVQHGVDCAVVGEAIVKATVGKEPGLHTEPQAQAMKDVLFALGFTKPDPLTVDPALRAPLATALADYASDTHEILAGLDSEYMRLDGEAIPPWESDGTYHLALYSTYFKDIVRAISEDPKAYAILRMAQTRHAARELTAVPGEARDAEFTIVPVKNARVFGILDGIGDAVAEHQDEEDAQAWRAAVMDHLLREPTNGDESDPAGHVVTMWLRDLENTPAADRPDHLSAQAVHMARTWTLARKTDDSVQESLLREVDDNQRKVREQVKRDL
ncbi:hypothetical protein [Streptomyces sp. TRM49041]|uniref:hypothetical protein n=1 Tax=Streptomyces sp. TRM49041 TaxID=2603216 RepID=UPI0011EF13C9|nr:hypothetical protein [Streptomyces sp. TRM49041]